MKSNVLRVIFEGYSVRESKFATCILLIRETEFSIYRVYEISQKKSFPVCSDLKIDRLIEDKCREGNIDFWKEYLRAKNKEYSFTAFANFSIQNAFVFKVPRLSESDFEKIIVELGGSKIPEATNQTPDFLLNGTVIELKDLQRESLFNRERQESIARLFADQEGYSINIDPKIDHGEITKEYHRIIANTIRNNFKKASAQIRSFKINNTFNHSGIIILNTGIFSLPHEMFKSFVKHALTESTTIQFAYIFSQVTQTNGFDLYAVFGSEILGNAPDEIKLIKDKVDEMVNAKMTAMAQGKISASFINSQHPISFQMQNKIFYWNPGKIPLLKKGIDING